MLEDEPGLDVGHLGSCGERIHREIAEVVGVSDRHVDEIVIRAGDVVDGADLGETQNIFSEGRDDFTRVALEPDRDHRLETETERNVRMYERFGFQVAQQIALPIVALPMWEMIRAPGG